MLVFLLFALASSQVFNVLDYGAKGDGETNNTGPLQTVIDTIEKAGGGVMLFPQGSGKFLSGSLFLTSNITVRIERGAALYGSRDHDDYPWIYSRAGGTMEFVQASLLNGGYCLNLTLPLVYEQGDNCNQWRKLKNVTLTGGGIIDGQGDAWWDNTTETRPTLLGLLWVDGLVITNLTIQNSPFWNVHPTFCNNVIISHLNITAPDDSPNTDGIDPDSTSNVHIHDCIIDVGDDCIAVKSGKDLNGRAVGIPTQNITIERMQFLHGHGVSIGSEMSGGVKNVTFRDSVCNGTQRAVRVKTCRGRGGTVEDIYYYNFSIASVDLAVSVNMYYCDSPPTNASATPIFKNIITKNLTAAVTSQAGEFLCLPEAPCTGINMTDVVVQKYSTNWDCEYAYGSVKNVTPPLTCLLPSTLNEPVQKTAVL